jgi:hypothetical protein
MGGSPCSHDEACSQNTRRRPTRASRGLPAMMAALIGTDRDTGNPLRQQTDLVERLVGTCLISP